MDVSFDLPAADKVNSKNGIPHIRARCIGNNGYFSIAKASFINDIANSAIYHLEIALCKYGVTAEGTQSLIVLQQLLVFRSPRVCSAAEGVSSSLNSCLISVIEAWHAINRILNC